MLTGLWVLPSDRRWKTRREHVGAHSIHYVWNVWRLRISAAPARCFASLFVCSLYSWGKKTTIKTNAVHSHWKHDPKKMTKTTPVIITRSLSQSQAARQTLGFGFARWKMQKLQVPISAGTKAGKVVIWADVKAKEESIQEGRREMRWKARTCSWEGKRREDSACRDFSEVSLSELEENDSNFPATQSLLSPFSPLSLPLTWVISSPWLNLCEGWPGSERRLGWGAQGAVRLRSYNCNSLPRLPELHEWEHSSHAASSCQSPHSGDLYPISLFHWIIKLRVSHYIDILFCLFSPKL